MRPPLSGIVRIAKEVAVAPDANFPGMALQDLDTPALVVDLDLLESNIARMARFLDGKQARLRPHYKTHKTPAIALKQVAAGAIGITCAKVEEAETLVSAGIRDILIANEIVGARKIARLAGLARHAEMMVAVDSPANVDELSAGMVAAGAQLRVLVDVNVGMNRCGVLPGEAAVELAHRVAAAPGLTLAGVMGYEGMCQRIKDPGAKEAAVREAMGNLLRSKEMIEASGLKAGIVSGGGTGTHAILASIPGITEIQAGTYALMDIDYRDLGIDLSCSLTLLTTVVSRPSPGLAITDAGLKEITNDHGMPEVRGVPGGKLIGLSEEHSKIELTDPSIRLRPGDKVEIIPSHACTTMNLHESLYGIRKGRLEVVWPIAGRGKSR
jgi:D-serine deaminase-like pyridoxal phosphate-dependent protein